MTVVNVVWFKRDLRIQDHAPLLAAISAGSIARINGNAFGVTGYSSMYLDEYRITSGSAGSGAARYTSSYTVPSAPFLDQ